MIKVESSKSYPGHYLSLNRSVRYSFGGFLYVGEWLYKRYLIDKVEINLNDTIIEIGANVGELSCYLRKFKPFMHVIEMDRKLISCLRLNLKNYKKKKIHNTAIWNKNGELDYLSSTENASSSIIFRNKKDNIKKTKSITLNYFFKKQKIKYLKWLKIEAEGGEIEVLEGAEKVLKYIKYISLDVSPERFGKSPYLKVKKILTRNHFKLIKNNYYLLAINKNQLK